MAPSARIRPARSFRVNRGSAFAITFAVISISLYLAVFSFTFFAENLRKNENTAPLAATWQDASILSRNNKELKKSSREQEDKDKESRYGKIRNGQEIIKNIENKETIGYTGNANDTVIEFDPYSEVPLEKPTKTASPTKQKYSLQAAATNADWRSRKPLRPIWNPGLVKYWRDNPGLIKNQLGKLNPELDPRELTVRTEFASLVLCNPMNTWYSCNDNPTCVLKQNCTHRTQDDVQFKKMWTASIRHYQQRDMRREVLVKMLKRMASTLKYENKEKVLFLMTLNAGFGFLFGNWLCSLRHFGVDENIVRRRTIVLARDEDARAYVESLGFFVPTAEEMDLLTQWTMTHPVSRRAAPIFGQGDHNIMNLFFKFGMPLDLLNLNYTVINQDVDFVWMRDPVPYMQEQCDRESCDAIFIAEGRVLANYPAGIGLWRKEPRPLMEVNTGLFMLRPTPQMVHTMHVMMQGVFLQQWRRRDQLYYNHVIWHQDFSHMRWSILPDHLFVPGKRLHRKELIQRPLEAPSQLFAIHVSDTGSYVAKIERFQTINHWYFGRPICTVPVENCKKITSCWDSLAKCKNCF